MNELIKAIAFRSIVCHRIIATCEQSYRIDSSLGNFHVHLNACMHASIQVVKILFMSTWIGISLTDLQLKQNLSGSNRQRMVGKLSCRSYTLLCWQAHFQLLEFKPASHQPVVHLCREQVTFYNIMWHLLEEESLHHTAFPRQQNQLPFIVRQPPVYSCRNADESTALADTFKILKQTL